MKRASRHVVAWLSCAAVILPTISGHIFAHDEAPATQPATRPVEAKALSDSTKKGLEWLADKQLPDGGWGQGEESQNMGGQGESRDASNVADTSMVILALMRSGSSPSQGPYATHIRRALEFISKEVGESDETSLFITDARNTRLQSKLGTYVDTFLAGLVLAEAKDRMPDETGRKLVLAALDKTMDKIEKNQQKDGGWANEGWAPALTQGLASKAVNRAAQNGAEVDESVRRKTEQYARGQFDRKTGAVAAGGSAGVELYARSSNLQAMKDSDDTNRARETVLAARLAQPSTQPEERTRIEVELKDIRDNREQLAAAQDAIVAKLGDGQFIAGFGSNGGEEFLSYMNIGETIVAKGGDEWEKWDKSMTENLNHIQNPDGSWSGHHCIIGKTFCTASALMVLMVDRAQTQVAGKIDRG